MFLRLLICLPAFLCTCIGHTQDSIPKANILQDSSPYLSQVLSEKIDSLLASPGLGIEKLNPMIYKRGDTIWIYSGICKPLKITKHILAPGDLKSTTKKNQLQKAPFIKIHGNVQYDFLHRSFVDTPFSQRNFQQHTIQTSLSITVKDKYPLRLNLSTRQTNSPFFRNFLDAGLLFDRSAYTKNIKQQLLDKIAAAAFETPDLKMLESSLEQEIERYNSLKRRLSDPDIFQRIIEEREARYYKQLSQDKPSFQEKPDKIDIQELSKRLTYKNKNPFSEADSSKQSDNSENNYSAFIDKKKKDLDSLQQNINKLQSKADSLRNSISKKLASVRQKVYKTTNQKELKRLAVENGVGEGDKKGAESFLENIKSIGIGRSMVNYSELTAWNVSLTGFNMEYNPGIYTAIAAGKIDYGFRDFWGRNSRQKKQNLLMARIGIGDKEKRALIFSAFGGRKYNYGSAMSDTISNHVNVMGYSVEAIWKKDENTSFNIEMAKTTRPLSGNIRDNGEPKNLFNFSDNSNLGISLKGQSILKQTDTRVSGFYRKTGENFQSFSLFTYNTDQIAWLLKLDQPFFKNKIGVIAMLRRNDFTNPFTEKTFKTSTIFKSIQVNARFPKWPSLSAGYYPGSQLYIIDKERIRENAYYILNASVVHNFSVGGTRMLSSLIYNQYSSKGTDTGFISYNGTNYMASHSLILRNLQLQAVYSYTDQEQMQYSSLEANGDYSFGRFIRLGGGVKYNKVMSGKSYWGSRAQLGIELQKWGGLQLQYEKSFLPTIYQTLFPVEIGRVSWFKYF